ncbi:MAG: hypothetical protein ACK5XX_08620 [Holosporales bacterium]|jgi:hypothetical protein
MRILFTLLIALTVSACAGRVDDEASKANAVSVVPYENFVAYMPRQAEFIPLQRGTAAFAACDNAVACNVLGLDSSAVNSPAEMAAKNCGKNKASSKNAKKQASAKSGCGKGAGCGCMTAADSRKPLPRAYLSCSYAAYNRALNSEYLEDRDEITVGKALLDACMIHEGYMPRRLVGVTVPATYK